MAIKGVLFDKDGTLLDYFNTWMPVNWEVARALAGSDEILAERLLVQIGYDGPIRAEPFNKKLNDMENEAAVKETAEKMKRAFALVD